MAWAHSVADCPFSGPEAVEPVTCGMVATEKIVKPKRRVCDYVDLTALC